ncbi:MAG: GGDEF domain-containing protein [Kiloniellales bacterium]
MKIRNTGYAGPYAAVAPAAPGEVRAGAVKDGRRASDSTTTAGAAAAGQPVDEASVMGLTEAELTPKVRSALTELMAEVHSLRAELEQAKKRVEHLERLADQDGLIPVLNRRAFVRELSRIMAFNERYGAASAVIYFDVNGLKAINDTHGHAAGDAALSHVGQVLSAHVRGSDVVGRLGGDEFGVILVQAPPHEVHAKATQLAQAIMARPVQWEGYSLAVGASFGVHTLVPGQQAQDALDAADRAMYQNKRADT